MTKAELIAQIKRKESFLCVGLDPDLSKIPAHLLQTADPLFEFCKEIIDATHPYAVAFKPNTAFFECHGAAGWESLRKTIAYIPKDCLVIADAKRGDIGNTSAYYAKTFFEHMDADALTVAPYMGSDSVLPFLQFDNKWVILLALTSNEGAKDFQFLEADGKALFEQVLLRSSEWGSPEQLMYVVGATRAEDIARVRALAPDYFFLVPGVGAQGGDLDTVVRYGANEECGLLVNSSRAIIYASSGQDFAAAAKKEALKMQAQMALHVQRFKF
ncbi:MAG: orotidine-5-phosphate decarboxylase [Bacteroidota bacterium]|jgi:orotidine-5'-phosphate decarboxylase